MTQLKFIKEMKVLSLSYRKDIDSLTISTWYEYFKDISYDLFSNTIKTILTKAKFFPSKNELKEEYKNNEKMYFLSIAEKMKDNGYFKKGVYGELSDEQAFRNYDKTLMFIEKGIIPNWLKEDMTTYLSNNKLSTNDIKYLL